MNYHYELNQFITNIKKPVELLQQQISYINLECDKRSKKYYEKLSVVNDLKLKLEQEIEIKTKYENMLKQLLNARDKNNQKKINDIIYSNKMNEKDFSPISKTYRKSETQRIQKSEGSNKRKIKFSFIKKIIPRNSNDYDKIMKKLNSINKEIDKNNKVLLIEYQKLDKRQNNLNEVVNQRDELKKQLDNILNSSEMMKKELIKEFFHKLNSI
jgi:chromosome segregation ATPase